MNELDFVDRLLIPIAYRTIIEKFNQMTHNIGYEKKCDAYSKNFNMSQNEMLPKLFSNKKKFSKELIFQNTILLKQAKHFGVIAKNAVPEIQPLLYHYAENALFSFFMYSLFDYGSSKINHGLTLRGEKYGDIGIQIKKTGIFPRLINCYAVLGAHSVFSPFYFDSNLTIKPNTNNFSYLTEPVVRLSDIIEFKEKNPVRHGHLDDLWDFLLLFIGSNLSRYKPFLWHEIVNGQKGDEVVFFNRAFERYPLVMERILQILHRLSDGESPIGPLFEYDILHKNNIYFKND